MSSKLLRWSGPAAMLGGLLYVALTTIYFVFTHGSTEAYRGGTLFGFDRTDYSRLDVVWPLLLMLGLAAFHEWQARQLGRSAGRMSFTTAMIALAMLALSAVLQYWIVDPEAEFNSIPVSLGFFLGLLAYVALAVSMIVYGIATVRAGARPLWRGLPLAIGLLGVASVLVELFVLSDLSIYGLTRDLVYSATRAPWGLGWVLLGYALWKDMV